MVSLVQPPQQQQRQQAAVPTQVQNSTLPLQRPKLLAASMPEGDRGKSYRLACNSAVAPDPDDGYLGDQTPSDVHTSDSEDTWNYEDRWMVWARWVLKRWHSFVIKQKTKRGTKRTAEESFGVTEAPHRSCL